MTRDERDRLTALEVAVQSVHVTTADTKREIAEIKTDIKLLLGAYNQRKGADGATGRYSARFWAAIASIGSLGSIGAAAANFLRH